MTLRDALSVSRFSICMCVLLSSLAGALAYMATLRSIESAARERFLNYTRYAQSVIGVRTKSYTDLLRSTAIQVQTSYTFGHGEFHNYLRGLDLARQFPALDFVNLAVLVSEPERRAYLAGLNRELAASGGRPRRIEVSPPGIRPSYLIVSYMEPDEARPAFYGIDLLANPYFGSQLAETRDRGALRATGAPIPLLSTPNETHLGIRTPVYRHGMPLDSVEQRRAAYFGSLGVALSLPKLLDGVLAELPLPGMRMTVYDVGPGADAHGRATAGRPRALFDSRGSAARPRPALAAGDAMFTASLPLDFDGRPWAVVYSVRKACLFTDLDVYYLELMMAFGFFGALLMYALLHTLMSSRRAALGLAQEMTRELRASQRRLQLAHQKLRRLADHAYQIKELERKRIAREIHDDLGQNLLALRIEAELLAARTRARHSRLHGRARATLQQIDATIRNVRQIINDLRPTVLDLGLAAAVEWQVEQFRRRTGIACAFDDAHGEIALPDQYATAFFRILQESLTNIVRHANATEVAVELRLNAGWLSLTVRDNGCGLAPGGRSKQGSFGLVGIEERIVILGGTSAVFSEPGAGTTLMVAAPVAAPDAQPQRQQRDVGAGSAVV